MEWLAKIISILPLDFISRLVSSVTVWWSRFVSDVPPDMLPTFAYISFSVVVLILWVLVARVLPKPVGSMSWIAVFSILLTPSVASGSGGEIAPASIAVIYGILMKDFGIALRNLLPILVVFTLCLVLGFIWQLIRQVVYSSIEKSRLQAEAEAENSRQEATNNYIELVQAEVAIPHNIPEEAPEPVKVSKNKK